MSQAITFTASHSVITHKEALKSLRTSIFQEYPYYYKGDSETEETYLRTYPETTSIIIVAKDGSTRIGAALGMPLSSYPKYVEPSKLLAQKVETLFYLGDLLLLQSYRERGIGERLYTLFENEVTKLSLYEGIFLRSIVPNKSHPCPPDYRPIDSFWAKHGYSSVPETAKKESWHDIVSLKEESHTMVGWVKYFA